MNSQIKNNKIDFVKNITLLLVVFAHCSRMFTKNGAIAMIYNPILNTITNYIYGFHMPLFFLLSGVIFSICIEKGKYKNNFKFITNKFKRLIIPYIIFGTLYVAPVVVTLRITKLSYFQYLVNGIILGNDQRHLWYLTSLFGIFILTIVLRPKKKTTSLLALILSLLLMIVFHFFDILPIIIKNVFDYMIYFYIGYNINNYLNILDKISNVKILKIFIILILSLIYSIVFIFKRNGLILSIYGSITWFIILYFLAPNSEKIYNTTPIKQLRNNGMGIYLFHPMLIYILFYILRNYNFNPYFLTFIVFLIALYISIILSTFVKKIRLSWIMGENINTINS